MAKIEKVDNGYWFDCPGCGQRHVLTTAGPVVWIFNGDLNHPTFSPSLLARSRKIGVPHTPGAPFDVLCHSFIRDGCIQFLSDSTHLLAGQTVELPEFPSPELLKERAKYSSQV